MNLRKVLISQGRGLPLCKMRQILHACQNIDSLRIKEIIYVNFFKKNLAYTTYCIQDSCLEFLTKPMQFQQRLEKKVEIFCVSGKFKSLFIIFCKSIQKIYKCIYINVPKCIGIFNTWYIYINIHKYIVRYI